MLDLSDAVTSTLNTPIVMPPFTHSQMPILIAQRLAPSNPFYNMTFSMVFAVPLCPQTFRAAWRRVIEANASLRSVVDGSQGIGSPLLRPVSDYETQLFDLRESPNPESAFQQWGEERARRPLALDRPLIESALFDFGDGRTGWYLNQHHLLCDAWSTSLLYRQVGDEYAALVDDTSRPTPLVDYALATQNLVAKSSPKARKTAQEHWAERIRGHRQVPLYGRPCAETGGGCMRLSLPLDAEKSAALERIASQQGFASLSGDLSLFAVFATLIESWISRLSGLTQISIDAPAGGRTTPESKRALGPLIEMFPFTVSLEDGDTFRELGARCLEEATLFLQHAHPGTGPISSDTASNIAFNFFPHPFGPFAGHRSDVRWVHTGADDRLHALQVHVRAPDETRYSIECDFSDDALPPRLRARSLEHLRTLLDAFVENPDTVVATIDVRTEEERRALDKLNQTYAQPVATESLVFAIERQIAATPERVALRQGTRELSFEQFGLDSGAVAAALQAENIGGQDLVAIMSRRSIETIVATVGILRSGAAYVPIDPRYPAARVRELLGDSGTAVLLDEEDIDPASLPPGVVARRISDMVAQGQTLAFDPPSLSLDDLAYLLYTSGSSGRPKGVLVDHAGVSDHMFSAARRYVRGERMTFALFASLSFDMNLPSVFMPLLSGGTLEVYPQREDAVDSAVLDVVASNSVDFIHLTPAHLSLALRAGFQGTRIRRMAVGGEEVPSNLAARVLAAIDGLELHNEYGPTEAVIGCTAHRVDDLDEGFVGVPIGQPLEHVEVEILGSAGTPVPEGVPGELWVTRFGLARGYHGLEAETTERFRELASRPGTVWYRTGDLVRLIDPETLIYLGRADRQLKIDGVRVEPGETEAAMLRIDGVENAAVLPRRKAQGSAHLAAYYVSAIGLGEQRVRKSLSQRLPPQLVPSVLVRVDTIPLTVNGKVDGKALDAVAVESGTHLGAEATTPPSGPVEEFIAHLWRREFGVEVGGESHFFRLGGTSLGAMEFIVDLCREFDIDLPLDTMFRHPSLAQVAHVAEEQILEDAWTLS